MKELLFDTIDTEIGSVLLVVDPATHKVCAVDYREYESRMRKLLQRHFGEFELKEASNPGNYSELLKAYFQGDLTALDSIEVSPGGTPFQQQVWELLRTIPPATTASYGELAARLGKPGAARAVGLANSLNPVAIIIPCHRVIGANASLTGYAGGLERKRWLLDHEKAHTPGKATAEHAYNLSLW
ncbi:MAG TPA: methylated-DNA--[protein]-cysteine S-methyltransferase [Chloroflexia bacterium]|nr:methylated-DNA--[protein]-cysteine S-methyltransferase [Chloroflexia bacterium]